jgi:glutathione-independent formaldehyde dehydrogenase
MNWNPRCVDPLDSRQAAVTRTAARPSWLERRQLMYALLNDRLPIAKIVNAQAISLEDAPRGYAEFDKGIAAKFVLDPHGLLPKSA